MDYKDIQKLIQTVSESELQEVEIELEGFRLVMKKGKEQVFVHPPQRSEESFYVPMTEKKDAKEMMPMHTQNVAPQNQQQDNQQEGKLISSPIVGTFYAAPHPDSPPFVSVGQKVKKGQLLCIIEAMKLMNEIESDVDGEVVEVLVNNEELVQYGQPLFRIV